MAKILVVEDDVWSRRLVIDLLEMRGHDVLAAGDIPRARAMLQQGPEVVLLDLHVPGGGGQALLAEIRADAALRELPVIAFTASAMTGDRERFLRLGFTSYLSKPIDVREFGPVIESYVGGPPA
ncbi:MAG: response regulator [Myxococcales bacterium]|nr:response regulator [Myxococcales bacterium]